MNLNCLLPDGTIHSSEYLKTTETMNNNTWSQTESVSPNLVLSRIRTSSDGFPLATKLPDLFQEFPHDRLPDDLPWLSFFLRPQVVVGLIIFYLFSKHPLKALRDFVSFNPKHPNFKAFVAAHNLGLAIFSAICAYNSWPIVLKHLYNRGAYDTFCDVDGSLWGPEGLGSWNIIFYVSKFYEFVDTWILVLKGKEPSFLQTYHHAGVALLAWAAVVSHSGWLLSLTLLNSVIHTMMYTYFFIKTVHPKAEIKIARYLTMSQIGQFVVGIASTIFVLGAGEACHSETSRYSLALGEVYVAGLIVLFANFSKKKYKQC